MVPDVDTVNAVLTDGAATPSDVEVPPIGDLRLETRVEDGYVVASGEDLGSPWAMRRRPEGFLYTVGDEESGVVLGNGSYAIHEVPGGAVLHYQLASGEGPVTVTVDGTGATLVGRWMPTEDAYGEEGRMWIVFLPGSGSGTVVGTDGFPAQSISWPPSP
jgi:hypothetical protein